MPPNSDLPHRAPLLEPPRNLLRRGPGWLGCLGLFFVFLALVSGLGYMGARMRESEDPYFHGSCPAQQRDVSSVSITAVGFSVRCPRTTSRTMRFVNTLTDRSVTLCLGRGGVCATGHRTPFPGDRVTLRPGESRKLDFSPGSDGRRYPVTIMAGPGDAFARTDTLVVSAHDTTPIFTVHGGGL